MHFAGGKHLKAVQLQQSDVRRLQDRAVVRQMVDAAQHVGAMRSCSAACVSKVEEQGSVCQQDSASMSRLNVGAQQCTGDEAVKQGIRRTPRACRTCWQASS